MPSSFQTLPANPTHSLRSTHIACQVQDRGVGRWIHLLEVNKYMTSFLASSSTSLCQIRGTVFTPHCCCQDESELICVRCLGRGLAHSPVLPHLLQAQSRSGLKDRMVPKYLPSGRTNEHTGCQTVGQSPTPHFLTTEQEHRSPGGSVMPLRPPRNHLGKNLPTASPSPISTIYRGLDLTSPG